jgi:hypothetical protein
MSFFRKIKFKITFECRTTDKQDADGSDSIVVDQSIPIPTTVPTILFNSKEEAYRLTGDLNTWAKSYADIFAEEYANLRCPGPTIYASDWNSYVDSVEEGSTVPNYVLGEIEYMEKLYREAETVDEKMALRDEINKLKETYGIK